MLPLTPGLYGRRLHRRKNRLRRLGDCFVLLVVGVLVSTTSRAEETRGAERKISPAVSPKWPITALAFAPDAPKVIVGSQAGLEVRKWPELEVDRRLDTELAHVHDLVFSPDGQWLAVAGGDPADSGTVEVRRWPEGRRAFSESAYGDLVYAVAWSPDSMHLACGSYDRTVGVHDAASGKLIRRLEGHSRAVLGVSYAGDRETLVSAGVDLSLRVWDLSTGKRRRVLDNHTAPVFDLAARPSTDGGGGLPMIASVSEDRTLRLWQPTIGRLVRFVRFPAKPLAVEWTAKGARLIVVCDDGHLRVVDPDSIEVVQDIAAVKGWAYSVAIGPREGEVAVGGERGQLVRVNLATD